MQSRVRFQVDLTVDGALRRNGAFQVRAVARGLVAMRDIEVEIVLPEVARRPPGGVAARAGPTRPGPLTAGGLRRAARGHPSAPRCQLTKALRWDYRQVTSAIPSRHTRWPAAYAKPLWIASTT